MNRYIVNRKKICAENDAFKLVIAILVNYASKDILIRIASQQYCTTGKV